jgi:cyclic pyranopterin phosphate synthase
MVMPDRPPDSLTDGYSRRISYLRLSVTDRCDLRCGYCMPAGPVKFMPRRRLLDRAQLVLLAEAALELGIRKIRITGGEPLLREDIVPVVGDLARLPDLQRLVMTTNGQRLAHLARDLRRAGLHGVNVSVDSLRPRRYAEITGGGRLDRCRAGIQAALDCGLRVKLNVVLMNGINDDEVLDFARLAQGHPLEVRFIEYMPTGGAAADPALTLPTDQVLSTLAREYGLEPLAAELHPGPARRFRSEGWPGTVGVSSPVSHHVCQDCNRIRVTAAGLARSCLFHDTGLDLAPILRRQDRQELVAALRQVAAIKPRQHNLMCGVGTDEDGLGPVIMSRLGG